MDSDINERNGFECGESHCLRIEDFCGQGLNAFKDTFDKICPGFHFLNFRWTNYINRMHEGMTPLVLVKTY